MVSLALLVILLMLLPFAIRAATRRRANRGLRWHGIQWDRPDEAEALVTEAVAKQKAGIWRALSQTMTGRSRWSEPGRR